MGEANVSTKQLTLLTLASLFLFSCNSKDKEAETKTNDSSELNSSKAKNDHSIEHGHVLRVKTKEGENS